MMKIDGTATNVRCDGVVSELESEVRSYCRTFPTVFESAHGATLRDVNGRSYVDFFSGAGALNYGHNNPRIKQRLLDYLAQDGIIHSLDMATTAKCAFLERFREVILRPRELTFKVQFAGSTGTNAVEAALKLARKVTGRKEIGYFRGAFHGMTLGALSVSGDAERRARAGIPLDHTFELPFESDMAQDGDGLALLRSRLEGATKEQDLPAAVIVETTQAEAGVRLATSGWLRCLERLLREFGVLLIVDDIQVGCGRTGTFFSFEPAGLVPDLICLSKSISGYGLPMSLVLIRPDLDQWRPGEHTGTFRGQNLSFVAGTEALSYWLDDKLSRSVMDKGEIIRATVARWVEAFPTLSIRHRGRGLIHGIEFGGPDLARTASQHCFERGLLVETAGPSGTVLKLLPPLLITDEEQAAGLSIMEESLRELVQEIG